MDEKQAKIEARRQLVQKNNEAWLVWCDRAGAECVDELLHGKVIRSEQAELVCKTIAQQLHLLLISGVIPPS